MIVARRVASPARLILVAVLATPAVVACRTGRPPVAAGAPEAPTQTPSAPAPPEEVKGDDPQLVVKKVEEAIVVAAWAEPKALPEGGGQAQLLVRVQKRGGAPFPGVEVRFKASTGSLFSGGKVLVTDTLGLTRDRLTARHTATVTLNAGGTRYTFRVPVGE
jgi:hypothetical protein